MEDCSVDLIYYTNSSVDYNRIVYINPKNLSLVKKYMPNNLEYLKIKLKYGENCCDATNTISDWFLECKYNPKYKYCRDKQYQDLLDIYEEQ